VHRYRPSPPPSFLRITSRTTPGSEDVDARGRKVSRSWVSVRMITTPDGNSINAVCSGLTWTRMGLPSPDRASNNTGLVNGISTDWYPAYCFGSKCSPRVVSAAQTVTRLADRGRYRANASNISNVALIFGAILRPPRMLLDANTSSAKLSVSPASGGIRFAAPAKTAWTAIRDVFWQS
jgi:hypothetical protein